MTQGGAGRRGFTLVEALVALVVAGFLLPSLARALGGAWSAARTPMEVASAMVLARDAGLGSDAGAADARRQGFTVERSTRPADVQVLASDIAPAPGGTETPTAGDNSDLSPQATPAGMKLAGPTGLAPVAGAGRSTLSLSLQSVSVVVRTPSRRRITLEVVRLDGVPR